MCYMREKRVLYVVLKNPPAVVLVARCDDTYKQQIGNRWVGNDIEQLNRVGKVQYLHTSAIERIPQADLTVFRVGVQLIIAKWIYETAQHIRLMPDLHGETKSHEKQESFLAEYYSRCIHECSIHGKCRVCYAVSKNSNRKYDSSLLNTGFAFTRDPPTTFPIDHTIS